ncbi:hypothetical protein ACFOD0_11065 [Shewanella intestini]|uniref:Uncharacterized protein n=1 Tax=Shewanella intestini TaxID=2017544 RepID=A0ABS5I208_9GAMM|nr:MULTISPECIES: hypothetical protein [Shewanella]MBR9728059.1 hypothetical protein [Shewanella intestini]MRG36531.1 hypothetical protein [Shewanella sp. XMDDZSB0408]
MLVNTNFPQVPIATSNVATDLARADNQQKPAIVAPQQPSKGHEERAFNSQNERAPTYSVVPKRQQQQQSTQQQSQQSAQQAPQQAAVASQVAQQRIIRTNITTVALQRRDIQNQTQPQTQAANTNPAPRQMSSQTLKQQTPETLKQFGKQIKSFYYQQVSPELAANFSARI